MNDNNKFEMTEEQFSEGDSSIEENSKSDDDDAINPKWSLRMHSMGIYPLSVNQAC